MVNLFSSMTMSSVVDDIIDEEVEEDLWNEVNNPEFISAIPQCFSHFTYAQSKGNELLCDLQGVWNDVDGFTFTDPVIHSAYGKHSYGATDKGAEGILKFFETHTCTTLCKLMKFSFYNPTTKEQREQREILGLKRVRNPTPRSIARFLGFQKEQNRVKYLKKKKMKEQNKKKEQAFT